MVFIGDAIFPGANDYPVKEAGVKTVLVRDPDDTLKAIAAIIACLQTVHDLAQTNIRVGVDTPLETIHHATTSILFHVSHAKLPQSKLSLHSYELNHTATSLLLPTQLRHRQRVTSTLPFTARIASGHRRAAGLAKQPMSIPTHKTVGAAVRTFPILLKWGLSTRPGAPAYPIGGSWQARQGAGQVAVLGNEEKRACVRANAPTLFHDLGVVAFDGCSYQQARRVGDILARVVALRTAAAVLGPEEREERAVEAFEVFPALWKLEEETWGHRLGKEHD
ncbi:HAD family hydrolase [Cordyceps militaris CM01]|uniref:HAD family hydrolase n=1 Tax=Cordyceps militaris (strain CM01) TaxID=983644 RepID=G3JM82_CORMM|nr:HAD family hydrolase [Cordyceps militaris CM01]EGX90806.1 HAD family hydrolase [Cordyceps militaris CM01]